MTRPSECRAFALRHPASVSPPGGPALARRFHSTIVPEWLASAVSSSRRVDRRSCCRYRRYLCLPSPAATLPSNPLAHILPPSIGRFELSVRFHLPLRAIQSLPCQFLGLHPSTRQESPVASGYSAACRP